MFLFTFGIFYRSMPASPKSRNIEGDKIGVASGNIKIISNISSPAGQKTVMKTNHIKSIHNLTVSTQEKRAVLIDTPVSLRSTKMEAKVVCTSTSQTVPGSHVQTMTNTQSGVAVPTTISVTQIPKAFLMSTSGQYALLNPGKPTTLMTTSGASTVQVANMVVKTGGANSGSVTAVGKIGTGPAAATHVQYLVPTVVDGKLLFTGPMTPVSGTPGVRVVPASVVTSDPTGVSSVKSLSVVSVSNSNGQSPGVAVLSGASPKPLTMTHTQQSSRHHSPPPHNATMVVVSGNDLNTLSSSEHGTTIVSSVVASRPQHQQKIKAQVASIPIVTSGGGGSCSNSSSGSSVALEAEDEMENKFILAPTPAQLGKAPRQKRLSSAGTSLGEDDFAALEDGGETDMAPPRTPTREQKVFSGGESDGTPPSGRCASAPRTPNVPPSPGAKKSFFKKNIEDGMDKVLEQVNFEEKFGNLPEYNPDGTAATTEGSDGVNSVPTSPRSALPRKRRKLSGGEEASFDPQTSGTPRSTPSSSLQGSKFFPPDFNPETFKEGSNVDAGDADSPAGRSPRTPKTPRDPEKSHSSLRHILDQRRSLVLQLFNEHGWFPPG